MKIYKIKKFGKSLIAAMLILPFALSSCCEECVICDDPNIPCAVREATITKFDPRLELINDSTLVPVSEYSIHTFQFPSDNSSTGSFPNDNRYNNTDNIIIARETFQSGGSSYYAVLYDMYPLNKSILGDIMIIDIDSANGTADLRFRGKLSMFPDIFPSENAEEFCTNFIQSYEDDPEALSNVKEAVSDYGQALPNASSVVSSGNMQVVNSQDQPVDGVTIPADVQAKLQAQAQTGSVNIRVQPGDVYYYKAANGQGFVIVIADIRQGTFEPRKKRVTIMFSAI